MSEPDSRIEAGALSLFERLDAWQRASKPRGDLSKQGAAQAVVDRWRQAVTAGDSELFATRLGWDGLDEQFVIDALSWAMADPESASSFRLGQGWFEELQADFRLGSRLLDDQAFRTYVNWAEEYGFPFVELWTPWVLEATDEVMRHAAMAGGRISERALECLSRHLLLQIAELGSDAAFSQFNHQRSVELSALDDRSGNQLYSRWVNGQLDHGLAPLFEEFPVLARQVHRIVETWKETTLELFDRLESDRLALATLLTGTDDLGPLVTIRPGLSDRHHGGRRVAILVFEGGEQIVYKTRSLGMERAFADFLDWLEAEGLKPIPWWPEVLLRQDYGWMEVVQPPEAPTVESVSRWFTAAGTLMCLAHVLGASDLHVGNVLPGAGSPVLVDLETLLHPEVALGLNSKTNTRSATAEIFEQVRSSFLNTGMLTFLQEGPDGTVIDIGGLCGTGGHVLGTDSIEWRQLGKDGLHRIRRQVRAKQRCNVPKINDEPQPAFAHSSEIQAGFTTAYRFVMSRRSVLGGSQGVMRWFGGQRARVLLRPTEMYVRVLDLSFRPACQRDGAEGGVVAEALNRSLLERGPRPPYWNLVTWERGELEAMDIPHLTAPVEASDIEGPEGRPIEGVISASGLETFERRLNGMSEEDLERQLHLMALSLEAQDGGVDHSVVGASEGGASPENAEGRRLSHDALLDTAASIADELLARAVEGEDQSLIWLDPLHLRPEGRRDRGVSYYLYSGSAGIALFLAAMAEEFPDQGYREAAEGALLPIVNIFRDSQAKVLLADEGLGACHGLGGIVYALTLSSVFLDRPEYIRTARQVVEHITEERIEADRTLDVEGGSAGAILGLLTLHNLCPEDCVLEAALACGRHLMAQQRPGPDGGEAWKSRQGDMLAGFAHGASGVALALARLGRLVNDQTLFDAVERALEFEDSLYDSEKKNWPLLLVDHGSGRQQSRNMSAWCHGAPGIALARSIVLDLMSQSVEDDMLRAALETTLATSMEGPDHLCCGTLGRVEVIFTMGKALGYQRLLRAAESRAAMVIQRAVTTGAFRLREGGGPVKAGFFRGLAGVGYQMLRLSRPDRVPSVLAFDPIGRQGGRP